MSTITPIKSPFDHLYSGVYSNVHLVSLISSLIATDAGQWTEQIKHLSIQPLLNYDTNRTILILDPETKNIQSVYQIENFLNLSSILFQYGTLKDIHISAIIQFLMSNLPKVDSSVVNRVGFKFYYYTPVKDSMQVPYTVFVKNTMVSALGTQMNELTNEYLCKVKINSQREMVWMSKKYNCTVHSSPVHSATVPCAASCSVHLHPAPQSYSIQSQTSPSLNTSLEYTNPNHSSNTPNTTGFNSQNSSFGFTPSQNTSFGSSTNNNSLSQGNSFHTNSFTQPTSSSPQQPPPPQTIQTPSTTPATTSWNQNYQNIFNKPLTEVFSTTITQPQVPMVNPFSNSTSAKPNPFSTSSQQKPNPFSNFKSGSSFSDTNVFGQKFSY
jgi:hypothetical protein